MEKFCKSELGNLIDVERVMVMDKISSTGCEVSISNLKMGQKSPFLHSHKQNEEVYIFTKGSGLIILDGESIPVKEGSVVRIDPEVVRGIEAKTDLQILCVQSKKGSLEQATREDGRIH